MKTNLLSTSIGYSETSTERKSSIEPESLFACHARKLYILTPQIRGDRERVGVGCVKQNPVSLTRSVLFISLPTAAAETAGSRNKGWQFGKCFQFVEPIDPSGSCVSGRRRSAQVYLSAWEVTPSSFPEFLARISANLEWIACGLC